MNMKYVSIDIRTTGLDPETCQILEIAAVVDDDTTTIENCPVFHCYVVHEVVQGDPAALSIYAKTLRRIARQEGGHLYLYPDMVASRFRAFLEDNGFGDGEIAVAGKHYASFDARFLSKLQNWDKYVRVRHRILDPTAFYWQPTIDGIKLPGIWTCVDRAGLASVKTEHTAVEVARIAVLLMRNAIHSRS